MGIIVDTFMKNTLGVRPSRLVLASVSILACLAVATPNGLTYGADCVQLSRNAADLVDAVLLKRLESRGDPYTSPAAKELGDLLFELRSNDGPVADEALCALLTYYLGEANDEDVTYQITARGRRLMPQLERYRESLPCTAAQFKGLVHEEDTRSMLLELVVTAIENGETVGAE